MFSGRSPVKERGNEGKEEIEMSVAVVFVDLYPAVGLRQVPVINEMGY